MDISVVIGFVVFLSLTGYLIDLYMKQPIKLQFKYELYRVSYEDRDKFLASCPQMVPIETFLKWLSSSGPMRALLVSNVTLEALELQTAFPDQLIYAHLINDTYPWEAATELVPIAPQPIPVFNDPGARAPTIIVLPAGNGFEKPTLRRIENLNN